MEFSDNVIDYLSGHKFSSGLIVPVATPETVIPDRLSLLEQLATGKNVIHLGCVDHLPLIEAKIKQDFWLHARLSRVSNRCLGLDINPAGIDYLTQKLGYHDVVCADLLKDDIALINQADWDYIIAGEILEHIDDPVLFLGMIRQKYAGRIKMLLITVPNAFAWANFMNALHHREFINSDHRHWFTPYTLAKIVTQAGLKVSTFQFCENFPTGVRNWKGRVKYRISPKNYMIRKYPALRETLLMEVAL
jgi:SAM-dependent methyltransferase